MTDVVDAPTRSRMMGGIRSQNTQPELMVRSVLHGAGFRFRLDSTLPGRPDIVLPRYKAVIFVHGCFWHAHACKFFKTPSTRQPFWIGKLSANVTRDRRTCRDLLRDGWRVAVVWECATRASRQDSTRLSHVLTHWLLNSKAQYVELRGTKSNGISERRTTSRAL